MHTTLSLLDDLLSHFETNSLYALSKQTGFHENTMRGWRKQDKVMNEETGVETAKILGLDVDLVLICLAYERAKETSAAMNWEHIYKSFKKTNKKKAA